MRKHRLAALAAALAITVGCATTMSLPDRLDKFVEKTEKEYKNYDDEDWRKSRGEYDSLVAEFNDNYDSFSTSDKVRTMKAMSRYGAMALEKEISEASGSIGDVLENIPGTLNDIIESIDTTAIRKSADDLKKSVEGIVESIDTARLRKSIEGLTENIDTAKLREKLEAIIKIFGVE